MNSKQPSPRGKQQVQSALINAGIKLFSARGMSNVSVRELADEAGVNHSLLFRHFGNKEGLIKAVFKHRFAEMGAFHPDAVSSGEQMLETSIRAVMQDEQLWRLMTFAALEGEDWILRSIPSPYMAATLAELEKSQREGKIYSGVEAPVLLASGFALGLGWAVFRKILMSIAGASGRDFESLRVQVDKLWEDIIRPR
jgi:AcrR family transcriptional regulator